MGRLLQSCHFLYSVLQIQTINDIINWLWYWVSPGWVRPTVGHCTTAAFIVLGIVPHLGFIGCTSKQVLSPSSHPLTPNPIALHFMVASQGRTGFLVLPPVLNESKWTEPSNPFCLGSWVYICTVYIVTDCTVVVAWPAELQCTLSVQYVCQRLEASRSF